MPSAKEWWLLVHAAFTSKSNIRFYNRIAPFYDRIFTRHKIYADYISDFLSEHQPGNESSTNVLDIGCGTGILSALLAERQFNVTGIDPSVDSLIELRAKKAPIKSIAADAVNMPFSNEYFHVVVALGVWRHFSDPETVMTEINRIISRNGILIVGYFPPAIAGLFHIKPGFPGKLSSYCYQLLTEKLGYVDRADFQLEDETIELTKKYFALVDTVSVNNAGRLIIASKPKAP